MKFPVSSIDPIQAKLTIGSMKKPSLVVRFSPFTVSSSAYKGADPLQFDTELRADFIQFPTIELSSLANKSFDFPVNPIDGYIDASVYFNDAHNPVDITRIEFGNLTDENVPIVIVSKWIMTYEGTDFEDFNLTFSVPLCR